MIILKRNKNRVEGFSFNIREGERDIDYCEQILLPQIKMKYCVPFSSPLGKGYVTFSGGNIGYFSFYLNGYVSFGRESMDYFLLLARAM